jgi:hypothetical protein
MEYFDSDELQSAFTNAYLNAKDLSAMIEKAMLARNFFRIQVLCDRLKGEAGGLKLMHEEIEKRTGGDC